MLPIKLTPAAFVLAIFCFALPFAEISCQGQTVATLTGIQVLTGTTVQGPGQGQEIPRDMVAIAAFVAALVGAGLAFKDLRRPAGVAGIAGIVLLLVYKSRFESQISAESQGAAHVAFSAGFWLAMLALAAGTALALTPARTAGANTASAPPPADAPEAIRDGYNTDRDSA